MSLEFNQTNANEGNVNNKFEKEEWPPPGMYEPDFSNKPFDGKSPSYGVVILRMVLLFVLGIFVGAVLNSLRK